MRASASGETEGRRPKLYLIDCGKGQEGEASTILENKTAKQMAKQIIIKGFLIAIDIGVKTELLYHLSDGISGFVRSFICS